MRHRGISVIIPNYNGKQLLEANLPSVYAALKLVDVDCEVIIVDDASSDNSVAFIKECFPTVTLFVNEENKGFSPTINRGIFAATKELVLSLNNDVNLTPDYFESLFHYFDDETTFGVMGQIASPVGNNIQDGAKYPVVSFKGIIATKNYLLAENTNMKVLVPSFFLSGANALMDRKKLLELGGFDELFAPYYYEDSDLGIRAWRVGWKCYFEPQAVCYHHLSSTIGKLKKNKVNIVIERNKILFNKLHLQGVRLVVFTVWLWLRCLSKLCMGNVTIYNAIRAVDKTRLENSRERLRLLQVKNNQSYSVIEVKQNILASIGSYDVRKL